MEELQFGTVFHSLSPWIDDRRRRILDWAWGSFGWCLSWAFLMIKKCQKVWCNFQSFSQRSSHFLSFLHPSTARKSMERGLRYNPKTTYTEWILLVGKSVHLRRIKKFTTFQLKGLKMWWRRCLPNIETKTGDVFRLSASGNVIDTVKTDPRLVPNHSVGMSVDGSEIFSPFIQMTEKHEHETSIEHRPQPDHGRMVKKETNCLVNLPLFFV